MKQAGSAHLDSAHALLFAIPTNKWVDADAAGKSEAELLLYRSNLLGSDLTVTNFGGGNTSAKTNESDPLTGGSVQVLWVKGSGGDIGSMTMDGLATLYMDKLLWLEEHYRGSSMKTRWSVAFHIARSTSIPASPSIDTPLHGCCRSPMSTTFIRMRSLPGGVIEWRKRHTGNLERKIGWLPWKRPGFTWACVCGTCGADTQGTRASCLPATGSSAGATARRIVMTTRSSLIADAARFLNAELARKPAFGGQIVVTSSSRRTCRHRSDLMPRLRGLMTGVHGRSVDFSDDPETL